MITNPDKITIESIRRLLRRGATSHLKKIVNKTHGADLSILFPTLPYSDQLKLFRMVSDIEQKGIIVGHLDEETLNGLIDRLNMDEVVQVFDHMQKDDVADVIERLPEEKADAILKKMKKEGSEEIEGLLSYGNETAGGIMIPDFIALKEDYTAKEAIEIIQSDYHDVEMPFYLYVVDEYGKLVGVCSLRQLVVESPGTRLREFMTTDVFSVRTDRDQEEVAGMVARYDILAVPVVDETNKLVGIVTVDDVIDILKSEATEDFLKMAGVGEKFVETKSVLKSTRIRLPWLFASCLGGIVAFFIIGKFEESLKKVTYLAAFIPVIMGMGGNIGTQSSTIVVRGLATGYISIRDFWQVVGKELAIGLILGMVYGLLIASVAHYRFSLLPFAGSVGMAVLCSMSVAALVGSLVPMVMAKINVDPAVATGPFVTTAIDIISVYFYFQIATLLLGL